MTVARRVHVVADLSKHLSDDIASVVLRHALIARAGGVSTIEWSAVLASIAESTAVQMLGAVLMHVDERRRDTLFDETIAQHVEGLRALRTTIRNDLALAERRTRR